MNRNPFASLALPIRGCNWCMLPVIVLFAWGIGLNEAGAASESANSTARLIASPEPDWPQWRGPRRDGICDETGLLPNWPAGGPRLVWSVSDLGLGFSAPIIHRGKLFITGDVGDDLRVYAFDLNGRQLWQSTNGRSWKGPYKGARACAAIRNGRLFHMNAHGRAASLDPETGRELWAVDILERFDGKNITWALSECLLVDDDRVMVTPGGSQALMAALKADTGETLWATEPLRLGQGHPPRHERLAEPEGEVDSAGYASPLLFSYGGRRLIAHCSARHTFGVDAETGELLWTRPLKTRYSVIAATPVLMGNGIFVTAPDAGGGRLLGLQSTGGSIYVNPLWATPLDTCHGCLIGRDHSLYGSWYRAGKGWGCVNASTGEVRYQTEEIAKGSILYADERLYCLSEEGTMVLFKPTATAFEFQGRFEFVPGRKKDVWTHPVIHNGRLYLRYHDTLSCYDIRAR